MCLLKSQALLYVTVTIYTDTCFHFCPRVLADLLISTRRPVTAAWMTWTDSPCLGDRQSTTGQPTWWTIWSQTACSSNRRCVTLRRLAASCWKRWMPFSRMYRPWTGARRCAWRPKNSDATRLITTRRVWTCAASRTTVRPASHSWTTRIWRSLALPLIKCRRALAWRSIAVARIWSHPYTPTGCLTAKCTLRTNLARVWMTWRTRWTSSCIWIITLETATFDRIIPASSSLKLLSRWETRNDSL